MNLIPLQLDNAAELHRFNALNTDAASLLPNRKSHNVAAVRLNQGCIKRSKIEHETLFILSQMPEQKFWLCTTKFLYGNKHGSTSEC